MMLMQFYVLFRVKNDPLESLGRSLQSWVSSKVVSSCRSSRALLCESVSILFEIRRACSMFVSCDSVFVLYVQRRFVMLRARFSYSQWVKLIKVT